MLISAFVSYVGYFTKRYRIDLMEKYWLPYLRELKVNVSFIVAENSDTPLWCIKWHIPTIPTCLFQVPIPITEGLDPLTLLTDDADIAVWSNQGLPSDRMSIENATILCNTQRWPLIVDAQLQGIKWIKNRYGDSLKIIRLGQKGYEQLNLCSACWKNITNFEHYGLTQLYWAFQSDLHCEKLWLNLWIVFF